MSRKQKQKKRQEKAKEKDVGMEYEIMEFFELDVSVPLYCKSCRQVHSSDEWLLNDFNCPTKGCSASKKIVIPWNLLKSKPENKNLPDKPESGKYYKVHL